jgi:hypothetical protein
MATNDTTQSPPLLMDFPTAMRAVINGQAITKMEWQNTDTYCMIRETFLMIHIDGQWRQWLVNDGDLMGTDWIVKRDYTH